MLNHDGGGVLAEHGKPVMMEVNATEKLYGDFVLTATNPGGHSSLPRPDNAIYELADALTRIANYQFPFELNPDYSRVLRAAGEDVDRAARSGPEGDAEGSSGHGGGGAAVEGSDGQLDACTRRAWPRG